MLVFALIYLQGAVGVFSGESMVLLKTDDQYAFGGKISSVKVLVRNSAREAMTPLLSYRIYQATSSTLAPLGETKKLPDIVMPPGTAVQLPLELSFPDVRAITSFHLKIYEGDAELGALLVRVCPNNVFSGIRNVAREIRLWEPAGVLGPFFERSGLKVSETYQVDQGEQASGLLLVRLPDAETATQWRDLAWTIPGNVHTIYIVGSGVPSAEALLPVKYTPGMNKAIVQDWFVPNLPDNALSQLRLMRVIETLLKPESVKIP